jgi:hypothetical protein
MLFDMSSSVLQRRRRRRRRSRRERISAASFYLIVGLFPLYIVKSLFPINTSLLTL